MVMFACCYCSSCAWFGVPEREQMTSACRQEMHQIPDTCVSMVLGDNSTKAAIVSGRWTSCFQSCRLAFLEYSAAHIYRR